MKKNRRRRQVVAADDRGYGRRLSRVRGLTISANAGRASFTNPQTTGVDAPFMKIYHRMPISRLVDGPVGEIVALCCVFHLWNEQTRVPTPNWDELEKRFEAKVNRS